MIQQCCFFSILLFLLRQQKSLEEKKIMFRRFQFITSSSPLSLGLSSSLSSAFRFQSSSVSLETIQSQIKTVENAIVEAQLKFNNATQQQLRNRQAFFPIGILTSTKNKMAEFDNIMSKLDNIDKNKTKNDNSATITDENIDKHFPLASVIGDWVESDLFQSPNRELLLQDPNSLCRWLISSSHLMIGEDHVDWACEALWNHRKDMRKKIDARLALRTITAFETWYVKESPQCFGMIPLMNAVEDAITASVVDKNAPQISAEEVVNVIQILIALFRKRNKGDRQLPVPFQLDEALAGIVRAMARKYVFDDPLLTPTYETFNTKWDKDRQVSYLKKRNQNFEEWLAVIGRFFRVGIRRFPLTLRPIIDSIFLVTPEYKLENNKNDFCYVQQWPVFVFNKLQQPNHGSSTAASSLTRQFIDSLDVVINEEGTTTTANSSSSIENYWNVLFSRPLLSMIFMQISQWPLRDVQLVSSLCVRFINNNNGKNNNNKTLDTAKQLLVTSLRSSHSGFKKLVDSEKKQSYQRGPNGKSMMNVESALCANLFLDLTKNSISEDILKTASVGLESSSSSLHQVEKRGNQIDVLEFPAQLVSSRFPHLRK